MAPTYPALPNTDLEQNDVASELTFQEIRFRDIGNSEKLYDAEFAAVTSTAGSGAPDTVTLDTEDGEDRLIPIDADRMTFECEVLNSDAATTGSIRMTIGGVDVGTILILAGETSFTRKTISFALTGTGDKALLIEIWRDTGAGNVQARALGLTSRTWNNE